MSAAGLERALAALGIDCTVEARDKLAIIIPRERAASLQDASLRRSAIALLSEHGFTHLALEIPDASTGHATLPGD